MIQEFMFAIQGHDRLRKRVCDLSLHVDSIQPRVRFFLIRRFIDRQLRDMHMIDELSHSTEQMLPKSNGLPGQVEMLVREANTNGLDGHSGIKHACAKRHHSRAVGSGAFRKEDELAQTRRAPGAHLAPAMTVVGCLHTCDELCGERMSLAHEHALQGARETADDRGVLEFTLGDERGVEFAEQDEDVDVAEVVGDDDVGGGRGVWRGCSDARGEGGGAGAYVVDGEGEEEDGACDGKEEGEDGFAPEGEGSEQGVVVRVVLFGIDGLGLEGRVAGGGDGGDEDEESAGEGEIDKSER